MLFNKSILICFLILFGLQLAKAAGDDDDDDDDDEEDSDDDDDDDDDVSTTHKPPNAAPDPDVVELVKHLGDVSWPWFGQKCSTPCSKQTSIYFPCFNLRPDKVESVLERAGINKELKLNSQLHVQFSSPRETVDVCGKLEAMPAVVRFKLNRRGQAIPARLKEGAEMYRRKPALDWDMLPDTKYTVLFWDVGLLKVRAYWSGVTKAHSTVLGKRNIAYTPPANPSNVVNPILIIVVRELKHFDPATIVNRCWKRVASKEGADECRKAVLNLIGDDTIADIVGLQVYYTDGSSLYEQYRACLEGYICSTECMAKYKAYAANEQKRIKFIQMQPDKLDMFVSIKFYSLYNVMISASKCGADNKMTAPIYEYRPVPGDNLKVDRNYKITNRLLKFYVNFELEISGTVDNLIDTSTFYAVLIVSPDGHIHQGDFKNPVGCLFYANLHLPLNVTGIDKQTNMIEEYTRVQQLYNKEVHYYILLYSHKQKISSNPLCANVEKCEESWDMSKLPTDFTLRGINWFIAEMDTFLTPDENTADCKSEEEHLPHDPPETFEYILSADSDADPSEVVGTCPPGVDTKDTFFSTSAARQTSAIEHAWLLLVFLGTMIMNTQMG